MTPIPPRRRWLRWIQPAPLLAAPRGLSAPSKAAAVGHYHAMAPSYERAVSRGLLRHLRARERAAVLRLAALDDAGVRTVLDVGCGGGFFARAAKRAGKWVHAVDLAPSMVDHLRADVDRADVADLESFSPGRTYHLVVCCGVLDFVRDPPAALDRLCDLVATAGRLVMLVPGAGLGCLPYKVEKRLHGLRVNAYHPAWIASQAHARGLVLSERVRPLPHNMALRLERVPPR